MQLSASNVVSKLSQSLVASELHVLYTNILCIGAATAAVLEIPIEKRFVTEAVWQRPILYFDGNASNKSSSTYGEQGTDRRAFPNKKRSFSH